MLWDYRSQFSSPPNPADRRYVIRPLQSFRRCSSWQRRRTRGAALASSISRSALSRAHRWLDELLSDAETFIATVAARERKSERSIRMILSLVFRPGDAYRWDRRPQIAARGAALASSVSRSGKRNFAGRDCPGV